MCMDYCEIEKLSNCKERADLFKKIGSVYNAIIIICENVSDVATVTVTETVTCLLSSGCI